jgi:trigger factor
VQVSVEKTSNLERRIKVTIPAEEIDQKTNKKLQEISGKVKLPGFRPGKVPMQVVKQRYGDSARQEIVADSIRDSYLEIIKKENLKPAGQPQIQPNQSKFGDPLEYIATLEVLPEIKLANMDDVKIEKLTAEVTDQDVENMLQKLLKQHAEWQEVEREAHNGDNLIIDFEGKIKGETFKGGSSKDFRFELGAGMMLADFETQLEGHKAGDTIEFKLKFPKDYTDGNVAGKKADFEVKIHKVLEPKMPEINEEFLKKVGITEGGEKTLKDELRKNMQLQLEGAINSQFRNKLIDKLLEHNPVEIPKVMLESEISRLQQQAQQQFAQYTRDKTKELPLLPREAVEDTAKRRVSLGLISGKIIEELGLKADSKQVKEKLEELTRGRENATEIINWYYKNREHLFEIEALVLEEQVMDKVQSQIKVEEKKVSFDEIMNPVSKDEEKS